LGEKYICDAWEFSGNVWFVRGVASSPRINHFRIPSKSIAIALLEATDSSSPTLDQSFI
jgi:hypothetical protein